MGNIIYMCYNYFVQSRCLYIILPVFVDVKVCRISCRLQELSKAVPYESSGRDVRFCGVIRLVIRQ